MTVYLSSFAGAGWQFFDANGVPLAAGKIYSYAAGTTTLAPTYTSNTGLTPHSNPIILNSAGRIATGEIWQPAGLYYKFALYDANDILLGTFDNIGTIAAGAATVENFAGTGAQITFTLASAPQTENAVNIYINGVYQQKNTFSLSSTTLTFSAAPPVNSTIEVAYF